MLTSLTVENLAVVEQETLSFSPHLNVLTGETGAGKSILIDALLLLLARRIPPGILRSGCERGLVEALFAQGEEEVLLAREFTAERSTCAINGRPVAFSQLQEAAKAQLSIYGQRDHTQLLAVGNHAAFLDLAAGTGPLLLRLASQYTELRRLIEARSALVAKNQVAAERLDYIAFQLDEIDRLGLPRGGEAELEERARLLGAAEEIARRARELNETFYLGEESIHARLSGHLHDLDFLRELKPDFASLAEACQQFHALIPELARQLGALGEESVGEEGELDDIQAKLLRLGKLKSKHQTDLDGLLDLADRLREEHKTLSGLTWSIRDLDRDIAAALDAYAKTQQEIRALREKGGGALRRQVERELARLGMKHAAFPVQVTQIEPTLENIGERGSDRVEFLFSSNPGQPPGPLAEVASGGEMSRLMLVLKSLHSSETDATFIFDEIDAGVGGRTAEFVGEKLRQIAGGNQVICISHLPQIASFADRHFLIRKEFRDGQTFSSARPLEGEARVHELARLMAGSVVSDDILAAATQLLSRSRG